jgi:hypothetical protein
MSVVVDSTVKAMGSVQGIPFSVPDLGACGATFRPLDTLHPNGAAGMIPDESKSRNRGISEIITTKFLCLQVPFRLVERESG